MNTSPVTRSITRRVRWAALLLAMLMVVVGLSMLGAAPDPAVSSEASLNFTKIMH